MHDNAHFLVSRSDVRKSVEKSAAGPVTYESLMATREASKVVGANNAGGPGVRAAGGIGNNPLSGNTDCPDCGGSGQARSGGRPTNAKCADCNGTGRVLVPEDNAIVYSEAVITKEKQMNNNETTVRQLEAVSKSAASPDLRRKAGDIATQARLRWQHSPFEKELYADEVASAQSIVQTAAREGGAGPRYQGQVDDTAAEVSAAQGRNLANQPAASGTGDARDQLASVGDGSYQRNVPQADDPRSLGSQVNEEIDQLTFELAHCNDPVVKAELSQQLTYAKLVRSHA
jgi:hypothetical protein